MRSLLLLLAILALSSCACVRQGPAPDQPNDCKVGVLVDHGQFHGGGFFWQVWFTNNGDLPHLVQEIDLGGGEALVEVFDCGPSQCVRDNHRVTAGPHARAMFVYPAEVEGVDWASGFAHLPMNRDGSVVTRVGGGFNEWYQAKHRTAGRVTKERRNQGIYWTITISQGKMTVTIGG